MKLCFTFTFTKCFFDWMTEYAVPRTFKRISVLFISNLVIHTNNEACVSRNDLERDIGIRI